MAVLAFPGVTLASDIGQPQPWAPKDFYPGRTYSPYAERSFPNRVYWGETHLHTGLSLDAGLFGNTLGHEEAYRFARGEEVTSSTGLRVKLGRPLDWLVITDHSDMLGLATDIQKGAPNIVGDPKGKGWHEGFKKGGTAAGEAAFDLITNFSQGTMPEKMLTDYSPGSAIYTGVWEGIIETAERFNEPGRFTALIGFEWTSVPKGNNLHRNVILRDDGDRARQVMPLSTQPPLGTTDPLDLYKWLGEYEKKTGGQALTLAHNGNLSNGWMFPTVETYAGGKVDKNYVQLRAKWEPLYEVTQIKGDGEAHPYLSPDDEFADYETWDKGNLDLTTLKKPDMLQREYAREALKNRHEPLQVRHGRRHGQPYLSGHGGGGELLGEIEQCRAFGEADWTPLHKVETRRHRRLRDSRLWLPGRVGDGEYARGDLGCHEAQGDLCDHWAAHPGPFLRGLGFQREGFAEPRTVLSWL
jgi:hypothetical protein